MKNKKPGRIFFLILIVLFINGVSFAQISNLDAFHSLVDSSVTEIVNSHLIQDSVVRLNFNQDESFPTFRNRLLFNLKNLKGIRVKSSEDNNNISSINYSIENADVKYGEMFRDGFLGSFMVPREIILKGKYSITGRYIDTKQFNYVYTDTVRADDLNSIENYSFPFTKGDRPSEPFFSSLFEPIVAIGSAALAVILFFTIRSK